LILKEENSRLKVENKEARKQIEENLILKEENSRLKVENKEARKQIEENSILKGKDSRLKVENKEARKQMEENSTLREEVQRLKEKINEITEEKERYLSYLSSMKEKTRELTFFDFSEYEEETNIGEGPTSKVKIVHKKETEKYVMKELLLFDHKSMQRFLSESELLFKLRHPSIIRVYGFSYGDKTHRPTIIMSHEPTSLEESMKDEELNEEEKNRIVVELVLGMRYIHKHKIIHRDLKPKNILLSKNKHVRITDFGLAKEEDFEMSQTKRFDTTFFMAPELSDDESKYNNKVDVYSFGVILIFILTGKYPSNALLKGDLPKLPKDTPEWVCEMIINCLSPKPAKRPSFAEIFEIMEENNYDLFRDSKDENLSRKQRIERRINKIEGFEFQHQ